MKCDQQTADPLEANQISDIKASDSGHAVSSTTSVQCSAGKSWVLTVIHSLFETVNE